MNSVQSGPESSCLRWVGRVGVCVVGSRRGIKVGEFLLSEALRNDGEIFRRIVFMIYTVVVKLSLRFYFFCLWLVFSSFSTTSFLWAA